MMNNIQKYIGSYSCNLTNILMIYV